MKTEGLKKFNFVIHQLRSCQLELKEAIEIEKSDLNLCDYVFVDELNSYLQRIDKIVKLMENKVL